MAYDAVRPSTDAESLPDVDELIAAASGEQFDRWYQKREFRDNIRNGTPYFNGPSRVPDPERHSPSKLLQCSRKILYRQENAPEESTDPRGVFWVGTRFEEELALPFLQDAVTDAGTFVTNGIWVDYTVETEVGELRLKGETDPVIVDGESTPILPTEIKTKSSLAHVEAPNRHHKAQLHAYLYGLTQKYDRQVTDGIILYASRDKLDVRRFHVPFDPDFWCATVLDWAQSHTQYRIDQELPPPIPEMDWECRFCSFRHRCGQADTPYENAPPDGLLPLFEYPRSKVIDYLESRSGAKLTPTLAYHYPDLAEEYEVYNWRCPTCASDFIWDDVDWTGDTTDPPLCPDCSSDGQASAMSGPTPDEQTNSDQMSSAVGSEGASDDN